MVYHLMEYFWAMKMEFTTALNTKSHEQQQIKETRHRRAQSV